MRKKRGKSADREEVERKWFQIEAENPVWNKIETMEREGYSQPLT